MQTTTVKLYSLEFANAKTYLAAALFAVGNILLPQLCHQVHLGGPTWLPIYFFTLVGACKYGWRVGLLTAVVSPLVNSLLFGMPPPQPSCPSSSSRSFWRSPPAGPPHASAGCRLE